MNWLKRIFNPLMAFIGIQVAWVLAVIVWLNWFLGNHRKLRAVAEKYSPESPDPAMISRICFSLVARTG